MSHMFARLMNSCKPEHELQNVQPQIKGISKAIDTFHKDILGTVREIGRWQVHQEPPVQNYLSLMAQFEEEIAAASVEYTDGYTKFAEFWEAVLEEHKSLQDTEKQHDKAAKQVEKHLGKKIKAETVDEPSEVKVNDETAALTDAQAHEQDLRNRLHTKMLAYEKNLHKNLRMAYYILHCARLDYYHKCEDISQRAIAAIDTLQDVGDLKEFEFLYQPFTEPVNDMAKPYWGYGKRSKKLPARAAPGLGAAQVGAAGGPAMDPNSPQFAAVSSATPMGLAGLPPQQQQQQLLQQSFQPPFPQDSSSRLGGVSQTPDVGPGIFPLSGTDEVASRQQAPANSSFWDASGQKSSSDIEPAPTSNLGLGNVDNQPSSSTGNFGGQASNSSFASSNFDQPSSISNAGDQYGSSSAAPLFAPSSSYNPDLNSSKDTSNISSDVGRSPQVVQSDVGSSDLGRGAGSSSIDSSSVFKPSEVSYSQQPVGGVSSPSHKQSTFLNSPSYMNPPSSSMNPDYSTKPADIGTPSSTTDKATSKHTDVGIGSSSERMF